ncbi:hypothetical protein LIA77_10105 [Sarocladium implicatum]|nr:hypothetical protein LIA77_10105 [Sarocladium implicatum]
MHTVVITRYLVRTRIALSRDSGCQQQRTNRQWRQRVKTREQQIPNAQHPCQTH